VFESVYLSQRVVVMTSRPGRIGAECHIESAEPRDDAFRTSMAYAGYCRDVSQALMQASDAQVSAAKAQA
jgi:NitT/TauT family transport system ATP-binding protein